MMYTIIENNVVVDRVDGDEVTVKAMFDEYIVLEGKYPRGWVFDEESGTVRSPESISIPDGTFVDTTALTGGNVIKLLLANKTFKYTDDDSNIIVHAFDLNKLFPDVDREVILEGDIVDDLGGVITAINAPRINLVVEMQADDKPNGTEVYLVGDIVNGHLTVKGEFPEKTNYKITAARNNRALDRLYEPNAAAFHMSFDTLDFLSGKYSTL